jgi:hypothetical protein
MKWDGVPPPLIQRVMRGNTMWSKKPKRTDSIDCGELRAVPSCSPARTWVNLFLLHMYKDDIDVFPLQKSKGIPPLPPIMEDDLPSGELSFDSILNRLKVLSGLDPVQFKEPKHGSVSLVVSGKSVAVETTFCDSDDNPRCTITMTKGKA